MSTPAPRPIDQSDLDNRFAYHPPTTPDVADLHGNVRTIILDTAEYIVRAVPPGREASLAVTALEEAMFWANAAIARNQPTGPDQSEADHAIGPDGRCATCDADPTEVGSAD